jgi:hypothetical protein
MASTRASILHFIAMLSVAHEDARTILLQSQSLVPSIIVYLTSLASVLWEESEDAMLNAGVAQR